MTRDEHMKWCKERAIAEYDHNKQSREGITSMLSDLNMHESTRGDWGLQSLCIHQMMLNPSMSREAFVKFINGFK
jgi:hypothetical protein